MRYSTAERGKETFLWKIEIETQPPIIGIEDGRIFADLLEIFHEKNVIKFLIEAEFMKNKNQQRKFFVFEFLFFNSR